MFRSVLALAALCATLLSLPQPSVAQTRVADVIRLDILDGGPTGRGTFLAAVRLTLADGWKTYWRAPGDAGIPPQFDWRRSRNLGGVSITWPTPEVLDQAGMQVIGYRDGLVLPLEITPAQPGQPVRLRGRVDLGICRDICIPGTLKFDHQLDPQASRSPAIAAALARRPYSATEAGVTGATCRLAPTAQVGTMRIDARIVMPSAGGHEVAVIEPGAPHLWAVVTDTRRDGNHLNVTGKIASASGGAFALDRSALRFTVLGHDHAVDIRGCTSG